MKPAPAPPAVSVASDREHPRNAWAGIIAVVGLSAIVLTLLGLVVLKSSPVTPATPAAAPRPTSLEEPKAQAARSTRDIVAQCEAAVAKVEGKLGQGTGFLAAPGVIATNAHVIDQDLVNNLRVSFPSAPLKGDRSFGARLLYKDNPRDLALLRVETSLAPLALARRDAFRRGEDIVIIGNPGGRIALENAVTRGVLSTEASFLGQRWYQLSMAVNPGNSGGPVIDSQGRVVGIVTLKASKEEGHGYCIPVEALVIALERVAEITPERQRHVEARHNVQSIFRVLRLLGEQYATASVLFVVSQRARLGGADNASRLVEMYEQARDLAESLNDRVGTDYTDGLRVVLDDPGTDDAVGKNLESLGRAVDQLRDALEDAEGEDLDDFNRSCTAAIAEKKQLVQRLARDLDVPQD